MLIRLQSDKMTALGANKRLTVIFYDTFSNYIPKWTTAVKKVFQFDA